MKSTPSLRVNCEVHSKDTHLCTNNTLLRSLYTTCKHCQRNVPTRALI